MFFKYHVGEDGLSYPEHTLKGEAFINKLRSDVLVDRSAPFNRMLLNHLDANPSFIIKECWEEVEAHFAKQGAVQPRPYFFDFCN